MAELMLFSVLEHLGHLLAKPYQPVQAVRELKIKRLRNELDLLKQFKEVDVMEVADLIGGVLDNYDLVSHEHIDYVRSAGALIGSLIASAGDNLDRRIRDIKALFIHINETIHWSKSAKDGKAKEEEDLVGVAFATAELANALWHEGESKLSAIAVLGGVGIGKTALAAKIYNSHAVAERFEIRAWIAVPSTSRFKLSDTLKLTARKLLRHEVEAMSSEEIYIAIRRSLSGRRYLLVFDGMRDRDYALYYALPDDGNGSRVIVTTRSVSVASLSKRIHRVEPLSVEASWELFCKTAFGDDRCPEELQEASVEILGTCQGHPLAIAALGDFLSTTPKVFQDWQRVLEKFSFNEDPGLVALSNAGNVCFDDDLPPYLGACFMYFSLFPEMSPIRIEKLVRLWIAKGFFQEIYGNTFEESAKKYLNMLVDKNLVKACEWLYDINKFSRVRELMHKMVRYKASISSCMVADRKSLSVGVKDQRLLTISHDDDVLQAVNAIDKSRAVRFVFIWNTDPLSDSVLVSFFRKYYFLTMLDIENSPLEILPEEVGYLSSLNYLSLKNTRVKKLPSTVGLLSRLELLDIRGSLSIELPTEIVKLTNLRHLQASHGEDGTGLDSAKGVKIMKGIGRLANLHTLATVEAKLSGKNAIRELKKLKNLRSLRVSRLTTGLSKALCLSLREMIHLKCLYLHSTKNETLDLKFISFPPSQLDHLVLKGKLKSFPPWIPRLNNLRTMCLSLSNLDSDPLNQLCHLANLESLWFYGAYRGPRLAFEDGFKKLKLLVLREMQSLEAVEIAKDTMPLLEELRIGPSPLMKEVPTGVASLTCLKVLSLYDMPHEFVLCLQPNNGSEFSKVRHVPSVLFRYRINFERSYVSYHSGDSELLRHLNGVYFNSNSEDVHWRDSRQSFSYSEDEEETASSFGWDNFQLSSFKSGRLSFFSDDIED